VGDYIRNEVDAALGSGLTVGGVGAGMRKKSAASMVIDQKCTN